MEEQYRVELKGVCKSFSGVPALRNVSLRIRPGEIHALVGENGAGKSTLMKILSGAYIKDEGEIWIDGKQVEINSPKSGKANGVGIVYQEFELAGDLTVAENIFLDRLSEQKIIRWDALFGKAGKELEKLGFDIDPKKKVNELSVAYQQIIEIAKVLSANARILIMDEPTAVLTPRETEKLFALLNKLKSEGVSIIYISHRMEEIFQLADTITAMRDGTVTGSGRKEDLSVDTVIEMMIGRKLDTLFPVRQVTIGREIFRVEQLSGKVFSNISFKVHEGEVFGIAGLVGSGRTEIARAIFGADKRTGGKIYLHDKELNIRSPHDATRCGIGLVPESRKEQGLLVDFEIRSNMTMANIGSVAPVAGVIRKKQEKALAADLVKRLAIKTSSIELAAKKLSGGNQQKVVLAKWFNTPSSIIIFDEPTRGVDVGAKIEIYNLINDFARRGLGVIIISSEMAEIIGLCDRVAVISEGRLTGELNRDQLTELEIMKLAVGGSTK